MSLGRREVNGSRIGGFGTRTAILNFRSRQAFDRLGERRLANPKLIQIRNRSAETPPSGFLVLGWGASDFRGSA